MRLPWSYPQDQNGRVLNDPLGHFKVSDTDDASEPQYYGNLAADGEWYIRKISSSGAAHRYARGAAGYTTAWTNRASLGYDYFDIIF